MPPSNMLTEIHPKLPMRNKSLSRDYYVNKLGFEELGDPDFDSYMMLRRDGIEIHFFKFEDLNPSENYGQVYIRTGNIDLLYKRLLETETEIHPNGDIAVKPWGQIEFSILDPDNNLITFGQKI